MRFSRSDVWILCICALLLLVGVSWVAARHAAYQRSAIRMTVKNQVYQHEDAIEIILARMRGTNSAAIEEAIFEELKARPSSSLITRSMVRVKSAGDGEFECVVDTRSLGVEPLTIRARN
jgi:hypothetical protein